MIDDKKMTGIITSGKKTRQKTFIFQAHVRANSPSLPIQSRVETILWQQE